MCGTCDDPGVTIPVGPPGEDGLDGIFGGFSAEWKFDTNTGSSPGSTYLRFNNNTYSLVTHIFISKTNIDSIDYSAFLSNFNNAGDFGLIRIFKEYDSSIFWLGTITNAVDAGSYYDLTVTYILSNGNLINDDNTVVTFTPRGNDGNNGNDGIDGEDGTSLLLNDTNFNSTTNTGVSYVALGSGVVNSAQLNNDGDKIKIINNYTKQIPAIKGDLFFNKLTILNNAVLTTIYDINIPEDMIGGSIIVEISRRSATTALIEIKAWFINEVNHLVNSNSFLNRSITIDFSDSIAFSSQYRNTNSVSTITHEQLTIEFFNKI